MSRSRCSHNIYEGRKCVEAARQVQTHRAARHAAAQQRTAGQRNRRRPVGQVRQAAGLARATAASRAGASATRTRARRRTDLDFNLWLGPAPEQPYHGNLVHYNWHWFWDFGNGDIGNQGIHEMDVARWAIKGATLPTRSGAWADASPTSDQGQTPNTQMAVFEYGDTLLVFEVRGLVDKPEDSPFKFKVANEYYTTDGMITDGKFHPKGGGAPQGWLGST